MKIDNYIKPSFCVIGRLGKTTDGESFVSDLWEYANTHFYEISDLAARDEAGVLLGVWGAMSDMGMNFLPWEDDFTKGLYLAGAEVIDDAIAPEGWVKWKIPGYEYLKLRAESPDAFDEMLAYMAENNIPLVGAVHDYMEPREQGQLYMLFPIRKL